MDSWLQQLAIHLPEGLTYLSLVALVAFLESVPLIGLAMPGSTLIVLAGFLSAHSKGNLPAIMGFCAAGAFLGDSLSYWLGSCLGQRILTTHWFKKHEDKFRATQLFFVTHGGKSLLYARFLGPIRGTTPFLAGLAHMKKRFFLQMTFISALLWGLAYPGLGYLGGESWKQAESLTSRFGLLLLLGICASLFHLWLKRKAP